MAYRNEEIKIDDLHAKKFANSEEFWVFYSTVMNIEWTVSNYLMGRCL